MDNSLQKIDVIYYLHRDGVLVPFEDAAKIMTFVSSDFIRNQTGYEVIDKIRREYFSLATMLDCEIELISHS